MNIIVALLIFTIIVVMHEFGHFLLAKKNGVGVPEFSVGMGPRIITFAKTKKGLVVKLFCSGKEFEEREDWQGVTKYSWKILPLGGSCAMVGEDEENDAEDSFNSKGVWARFSVIFAGPFFNFILAFIFSVIILANSGIDYPIVRYIAPNQPASESGLELGDKVKSINGKKITIGREIVTYTQFHPLTGEDVRLVIERDGDEKDIIINPHYKTYMFGFSYSNMEGDAAKIISLSEGGAFEKAGIKVNDIIKSVNGKPVSDSKELASVMDEVNKTEQEVSFIIERDGAESEYKVTPTLYETNTLGFSAALDEKANSAFDVIKYSFVEVKYWIVTTLASLGQLITGKLSMDNVSGPVGIVNVVGGAIEQSKSFGISAVIMQILYMSVLLSANLGVMNLLPFPALDGGRLVFILIEAVMGKPIDKNKEGFVHFAGFVILMLFMVFVMYNDIIKLIR